MIDTGLKDKVVLVTGSNNPEGIGAATARAFAAQDAKVFIHYFRQPHIATHSSIPNSAGLNIPGEAYFRSRQALPADEVLQSILDLGNPAEAWEADLADPTMIPRLFDRAEETLGPVQVLVNNAAHCEPDTFLPLSQLGPDSRAVDGFPMGPISAESHDQHFAVNSRAVALMMAEFARRHVERGARWGRIINVEHRRSVGVRQRSLVRGFQTCSGVIQPRCCRRAGPARHHGQHCIARPNPDWLDHTRACEPGGYLHPTSACGPAGGCS